MRFSPLNETRIWLLGLATTTVVPVLIFVAGESLNYRWGNEVVAGAYAWLTLVSYVLLIVSCVVCSFRQDEASWLGWRLFVGVNVFGMAALALPVVR